MLTSKIVRLKDRFSLLKINDRLALCYRALKRPGKGGRVDRIQCAYFGFNSEEEAVNFASYLREKFQVRAIHRESDRLPESAFEVKVWEFDELLGVVRHCAQAA